MSRYILIRRLRGPAFLLLVGVIALLHQAGILSWGHSWPLYLILLGVLMLAERAALAAEGYPPYPGSYQGSYQGAPYAGAVDPITGQPVAPQPPAAPGSAIVPVHDFEKENDRGQS
jgi:hypothetical protein